MSEYLLGFDIGGTKCAAVLGRSVADRVDVLSRYEIPTELHHPPEFMLARLEQTARQILNENKISVRQVQAIGISCGGPLDSARGVVLGPPNLPGWDFVPITQRFQAAFDVTAHLQNDADACALAEWKWGAGQGSQHLIFLTFGTGLGAGLILNGRLYSGRLGLAGEVGHIRLAESGPMGHGKYGSFEGFCSGGGIAQLARETIHEHWSRNERVAFCPDESSIPDISARRVVEAAREGDPVAAEICRCVARHLGAGLAILVDVLAPELIIIGGIFARARDLLWPGAHQVLQEEALNFSSRDCRIVPAALGEQIGDYASLAAALSDKDDS